MQHLRLRSKMWLEMGGSALIGQGRMVMLQSIDHHQSIIQASRETGISYRRIRGAIRDMEQIIGQPLVVTHRGGRHGGRAELTPAAVRLMQAFEKMSKGFHEETDARLASMVHDH